MKNIYLIGAGGHCKSCIDVVESTGEYNISGLFDSDEKIGQKIGKYEIIGTDQDLYKYLSKDNYFLITIGQIKSPSRRMNIADKLYKMNAQIATVVSSRAYISNTARIGKGTIVMHDALINSYAVVGDHCIINTKALVEHDSEIDNFCHLSTAAVVNGNAKIGMGSFIGSLAVLKEGLSVPSNSVLSAGIFHKRVSI